MDAQRFDALARLLGRATACRRLLFGLAMTPFAGLVARPADDADAKKKHKKKRKPKKPKPNAYGCLNVGAACKSEKQCCSGLCEGKKGKRSCRAHDTSICNANADLCSSGQATLCGTNPKCACVLTTGNAPFCGDFTLVPEDSRCRDCSQDTDCEAEFGPGAACLVYGGICTSFCADTGGTACAPPCADTAM